MEILPLHVYYRIREFTSPYDYIQLMNSNKRNFSPIKYETIYYPLTPLFSGLYLRNLTFREKVNQKLQKTSQQVGIYANKWKDLQTILGTPTGSGRHPQGFKKLTITSSVDDFPIPLKDCYDFPFLKIGGVVNTLFYSDNDPLQPPLTHGVYFHNVLKLVLVNNPFLDTSLISNFKSPSLKALELHQYNRLVKFEEEFLSRNLMKVSLNQCEDLQDVSLFAELSQLRSVTIISCPRLHDISCLMRIPELTLEDCPRHLFKNRMAFHNRKLALKRCFLRTIPLGAGEEEENVSGEELLLDFRDVVDLNLQDVRLSTGCFSLSPVFRSLKSLILKRALFIGEFGYASLPPLCFSQSQFPNLTSVCLRSLEWLNDDHLQGFQHLFQMEINDCLNIKDVSCLSRVSMLKLILLPALQTYRRNLEDKQEEANPAAMNLPMQVQIEDCPRFSNFESLENIPKVILQGSFINPRLIHLKNAQEITFHHFQRLNLDVTHSKQDESLSGIIPKGFTKNGTSLRYGFHFGFISLNLQKIEFYSCAVLTTLEGLENVRSISISQCVNLWSIPFSFSQLENKNERLAIHSRPLNIHDFSILKTCYQELRGRKDYYLFLKRNAFR